MRVNIKNVKKCAFCKHWYDPTNSAIKPDKPNMGLWEYNDKAVNMCLLKNMNMRAGTFCTRFECKL